MKVRLVKERGYFSEVESIRLALQYIVSGQQESFICLLLTRGRGEGFTAELYRHILKVPKCEIFDLIDSRDFYTIKPPRVDNFGIVIKKFESVSF